MTKHSETKTVEVRLHFPAALPESDRELFQHARAHDATNELCAKLIEIGAKIVPKGANDPGAAQREIYKENLAAVLHFMFDAGFPVECSVNLRELLAALEDVDKGASPRVLRALPGSSRAARPPVSTSALGLRACAAAAVNGLHLKGMSLETAAKKVANELRPASASTFAVKEPRVTARQLLRWREVFRSESGEDRRDYDMAVATCAKYPDGIARLINVARGGAI